MVYLTLNFSSEVTAFLDPNPQIRVLPVQHFTELLDDLSQEALLGQLLSDPFLSGRGDAMDTEEDLTPASPVPPHIQAEHSYSLCGDSRPQSPLSHLPGEPSSDAGKTRPESASGLLTEVKINQ